MQPNCPSSNQPDKNLDAGEEEPSPVDRSPQPDPESILGPGVMLSRINTLAIPTTTVVLTLIFLLLLKLGEEIPVTGIVVDIKESISAVLTHPITQLSTLPIAAFAIYLWIAKGSDRYGDLSTAEDERESTEIIRDASGKIAAGNTTMTGLSMIAQNPFFAFPQLGIMVNSMIPYLESRHGTFAEWSEKYHFKLWGMVLAAGIFPVLFLSTVLVPALEGLPIGAPEVFGMVSALGLTSLSLAYAKGKDAFDPVTFRRLAMSGNVALIIGSSYATIAGIQDENLVGVSMGGCYFILNGIRFAQELKALKAAHQVMSIREGASTEDGTILDTDHSIEKNLSGESNQNVLAARASEPEKNHSKKRS